MNRSIINKSKKQNLNSQRKNREKNSKNSFKSFKKYQKIILLTFFVHSIGF